MLHLFRCSTGSLPWLHVCRCASTATSMCNTCALCMDEPLHHSAERLQVCINLNGYTKGAKNEIFALLPAPVQTSYMGFPATTGASFLPYLITDRVVAPDSCRWELRACKWAAVEICEEELHEPAQVTCRVHDAPTSYKWVGSLVWGVISQGTALQGQSLLCMIAGTGCTQAALRL